MLRSDIRSPRFGWFYADVRKRLELPFVTMTESVYSPGFEIPIHEHEGPWFGFLLQGAMFETCCNKTDRVEPLTLTFRIAGESHSDKAGDRGARGVVLDLKQSMFDSIALEFGLFKQSSKSSGGSLPALMLRIYNEFNTNDTVAPLCLQGLMFELMGEGHRTSIPRSPRPPQWLNQATDLFRARFREKLSLSAVASEIGTHPVHLAQTFRRFCHCSVGEYIRRLRIESACDQLLATGAPIAEIALGLGFCDQAHFCKTFKRITGLTPGQLRESLASSPRRLTQ